MSKKYYMVLDTETANETPFDIAFVIIDRKGNIVNKFNGLTAEAFATPTSRFMLRNAQYMGAKKAAFYLDGIAPAEIVAFAEIRANVCKAIETYNCPVIAYNIAFDEKVLNVFSNVLLGCDFFPVNVTIWDMWTMALYTLCNSRNYARYCDKHDKRNKSGNRPSTAEAVFGYIADNPHFEEVRVGAKFYHNSDKKTSLFCKNFKKPFARLKQPFTDTSRKTAILY